MRTDFSHNTVKRLVQNLLFKDVKAKTCLGLAGPNYVSYKSILAQHSRNIILCDLNPADESIIHNSLVGTYDMNCNKYHMMPVNWVDADFCTSIINSGADLLNINSKLRNKHLTNYYLSFTFSIRDAGLENTLNWIRQNLVDFGPTISEDITFLRKGKYQYCKWLYDTPNFKLIRYKDSGDHMLSGIIKF